MAEARDRALVERELSGVVFDEMEGDTTGGVGIGHLHSRGATAANWLGEFLRQRPLVCVLSFC